MAGTFDVAIIGGGINGCGIARDAAGRGLSVFLCEQADLASGTSSASTKLIHGGLRYLEYYEFRLVRESLQEREVLWRVAPHIVQPLRFVLPHHKGLRPAWMLRLGLFLYDHLGGRELLPATRTLDLRINMRAAMINMQRGSGDHRTVIALDAFLAGKIRARIGRIADIDNRLRHQVLEQLGIAGARGAAAGGGEQGAAVLGIAFDDEEAGGRHRRSVGGHSAVQFLCRTVYGKVANRAIKHNADLRSGLSRTLGLSMLRSA